MLHYLPSDPEFAFAIKFLVVAAIAGMVLLGVRYLFEKRGATIVVLSVLGLLGVLMLVRSIAPRPIPVAQRPLAAWQGTVASPPTPPSRTLPSPAQPSSTAIQQIIGSNAPVQVTELPTWVKNPPHEGTLGAGYCKYVITSQLYATPEEAEAELNRQLAVDVQQSFTVGDSPAVGWSPTADDLQMSGLVTEKVIETVPMKVGEFDTTVHRVSWLVEFKPASQQALLSQWQVGEAQRRSKLILSAIATISGVMGVSAFMLRKQQTPTTPATAQVA